MKQINNLREALKSGVYHGAGFVDDVRSLLAEYDRLLAELDRMKGEKK